MKQDMNEFWKQSAEQMQQTLMNQWTGALQALQNMAPGAGAASPSTSKLPAVNLSAPRLQQLQQQYLQEASDLWAQSLQGKPEVNDKRFASEAWSSNPVAAFTAANYLLNARTMMGLADSIEADEKTRARVRFAVEQWIAASAPSNFMALNVEAQKKAIETKGESIAKGMQNLLHDVRQGHVSMTDESLFEVGRNVATTEGAVVFENELFQLIEYKPLTGKVFEKPLLLVPPCINKYYILDLQPENSLIRYAVEQGHRTFVVSWRNPDASLAHKTWDDYIEDAAITCDWCGAGHHGCQDHQCTGFLCRWHHPDDRDCGAGAARRKARVQRDLADHLARLHRYRCTRRVHRRVVRQVP